MEVMAEENKDPKPIPVEKPAPILPTNPAVDPFKMIVELPPGTFKKSDSQLWERRDNSDE
jgi:hypothetical protein